MQILKTLAGSLLLIFMLFIVVKASESADNSTYAENLKPSPEAILAQQKATKQYELKQTQLKTAIRAYFKKAIEKGTIVGAGVSVVQGDSILLANGFGKRSIKGKAKVNSETVFRLGSLSKGFAGIVASSYVAEGKFDWNDKLIDYIPEFQLGDATNTSKIKISHILSHSSGTPYHSFTNLVEANLPIASIAQRFGEVNPQSEPGKQYSYQNAMFALSQEVLQKATGTSMKKALQERIFKPLGMTHVSMNHETITNSDNVALPHTKGRNGWRSLPLTNRYYNAVAAGGIDASAIDMAKWMRFLLGHNPEVMSKKAIQDVFTPIIKLSGHRKYYQRWAGHVQSSYGLGWRIHNFKNEVTNKETTVWHHGGSVNNYRNEIAVFPETDLGICVLLNGNSKIARTVIPDLQQIVESIYK